MPISRDVYHVNQPYKALSDAKKVQLAFLIKALKSSKVLKVCKDQWHVKRRLAFTEEVRKDFATALQEK